MTNSPAAWTLVLGRTAEKTLERMSPKDERLVREALEAMRADPRSGDVVPLTAQPASFRRRAGNWRIFFDLYPERFVVEVVDIVRRSTTTYRRRR